MSTELNLATSADWPNSATAALRLGMAANADALRALSDRVLALAAAWRACPNCHQPHHGLVVTAPMGPDGSGVKHCGCFWAGDAEGKDSHHSTTTAEQHAWMRGERSEDEMANGVKGYVVRGKDRLGKPAWCYDGFFRVVSAAQGGWPAPPREYPSLSIAGGGVAAMLANGCTAVTIFAVATDGTETPLPSYEAALEDLAGAKASAEQSCALLDKATSYIIRMSNEIERLRAESVAAKTALLDAREHRRREKDQSLNFMRERDDARAEIERLRDDAPLAADPQVFRYATARASEAERVNWILQGLAEQVTAAATDVDLPAPLREASPEEAALAAELHRATQDEAAAKARKERVRNELGARMRDVAGIALGPAVGRKKPPRAVWQTQKASSYVVNRPETSFIRLWGLSTEEESP